VLIFSKYFYIASITSYYSFYLIEKFNLSVRSAQMYLFVFLLATAVGIAPACLAAEALYDGNGTPQPTSQPLVVTVPPASSGTEGSPDGIVSNGGSDFEVSPGSSSVVPAQRQLVNISTRASVGTGDNVAIA